MSSNLTGDLPRHGRFEMRFFVCLEIKGMSCTRCSKRVKEVIIREGFEKVKVNLAQGTATFYYSGKKKDLGSLLSKIEISGLPLHHYRARVREHQELS